MTAEETEEVLKINKKLDKINARLKDDGHADLDRAVELLKRLERMNITLSLLSKTKVGMTVNSLRKNTENEEVVAHAKALIKAWKKLVPGADSSSSGSTSNVETKKRRSSSDHKHHHHRNPLDTHDQIRLSCRKLLASALKGGEQESEEFMQSIENSPDLLAAKIEDVIYSNNKRDTGNMKYKNQVRSRVFNLKDKKNPALRVNVLIGLIQPEKIAVMTADEMASDELKMMRMAAAKEGMDAAQLAIKEGTKTSLLKCGKCKKNNCTYHQMQTRSADEPMTTFVLCNECGNRWKFC